METHKNKIKEIKAKRRRKMGLRLLSGILRNSTVTLLAIVILSLTFNVREYSTIQLVIVSVSIGGITYMMNITDILESKSESDLIQIRLIEDICMLKGAMLKLEEKLDCRGLLKESKDEIEEIKEKLYFE